LLDDAQPIALRPLTRGLKWNRKQVKTRLIKVRKGYMDKWVYNYMLLYIIYGQKPKEGIGISTGLARII
jgi:hypothetical protein